MGNSKSVSAQNYKDDQVPFLEYERVIFHIRRGDLIEIQRNRYNHWVICESIDSGGNIWCFHVTIVSIDLPFNQMDFDQELSSDKIKAILKYEPLIDILKDNNEEKPSLCRVNNQQKLANYKGITKTSDSYLSQIFCELHRKKDFRIEYNIKSLNCEHYCTQWKYGIGWSSQVNSFKEFMAKWGLISVTGSGIAFATTARHMKID